MRLPVVWQEPAVRAVFWRVLAACTFIFIIEGTTFGFPALRPLFLQAHVFEAACDTVILPEPVLAGSRVVAPPTIPQHVVRPLTDIAPVCDEQGAMLSALLITGAAAGDIVALLVGCLAWAIGRKVSFRISGCLLAMGFSMVGLGGHFASHLSLLHQGVLLHGGFVVVAIGHSLLFNGSLMYSTDVKRFPRAAMANLHGFSTGMVAGAYTLATLTPLALGSAFSGVDSGLLVAYTLLVVAALSLAAFAQVADPPVGLLHEPIALNTIHSAQSQPDAAVCGLGDGSVSSPADARAPFVVLESVAAKVVSTLRHWRLILEPQVWVIWCWAATSTIFMNWYQSTVYDQISFQAGSGTSSAASLATLFNTALPICGALGNVAFTLLMPVPHPVEGVAFIMDAGGSAEDGGTTVDVNERLISTQAAALSEDSQAAVVTEVGAGIPVGRRKQSIGEMRAWLGIAAACVLLPLWALPTLFHSPWLQLVPFVVFSAWRSGIFVTFYHHIIERFPASASLFLINGESLLAGSVSFVIDPIRSIVTRNGDTVFPALNGAFFGVCMACTLAALYAVRPRPTR